MILTEYVGKCYEALVQSDNQQLLIQGPEALEPGRNVKFGIPPQRLLLFPYDETAPASMSRARVVKEVGYA